MTEQPKGGVQVIDAWIPISHYSKKTGLGITAIQNRMRNGQLEWKNSRSGRLIHCKMQLKESFN